MRGERASQDRAGWAIGAGLAIVITVVGWLRHRNGWSGALDLGIFDQGVWLLSEGEAPEVTVNGRNIFADHLSPVLVLFAAPYALAATPVWLLAGQAAALGAGLPAVRRLAVAQRVAIAPITVAYLVSAPLLAAAIFDFHPSTMAVAPLAWLLVAVRHDCRWPVLLAIAGVTACRADLGWIVAACAFIAPKRHRVSLVALGVVAMAAGWVVPAVLGSEATFPVHYGHIADEPGEVLTHPWRLASAFSMKDVQTVALWLLPAGFLTMLAPRWLLAVVVAGLPVLLSRWPGTEDPFTHYGAPFVPLVLGGAIVALARYAGRDRPLVTTRLVVVGALAAAALASPLSPKAPDEYEVTVVFRRNFDSKLDEALDAVPPGAPVAAVNRALAHLTHRELAYGWPIPFETTNLSILYGGADPDAAAQIRVVIGEPEDRAEMEELGFDVEDLGALLIGRR